MQARRQKVLGFAVENPGQVRETLLLLLLLSARFACSFRCIIRSFVGIRRRSPIELSLSRIAMESRTPFPPIRYRFHSLRFVRCYRVTRSYHFIDAQLYFRTRKGEKKRERGRWTISIGYRFNAIYLRIDIMSVHEGPSYVNIFISCSRSVLSACITPWSQGPTALSSFALVKRYLLGGTVVEFRLHTGRVPLSSENTTVSRWHIRLYSGFFQRVYPRHSFREVYNGREQIQKSS